MKSDGCYLQRSHAQIVVLFKIKTWIDILVTVPMINTNAYSFEICTTWRSDFFQAAVIDRNKGTYSFTGDNNFLIL